MNIIISWPGPAAKLCSAVIVEGLLYLQGIIHYKRAMLYHSFIYRPTLKYKAKCILIPVFYDHGLISQQLD